MTLLSEIKAFIKKTDLSRTAFGRLSCNDPRIIPHLEGGREPTEKFETKIRAFMASYTAEMAPKRRKRKPDPRRSVSAYQHAVRNHQPLIVVDRDPCGFCGVRRDVGCRHYKKSEPVRVV